ncbi:hypothetical protein GIB67_003237 [Kingdonia uniflora]|uniref:Uncharacterized protein n=1 Tax=Kingdonia uniflora TaxID=39325 RepID=A0A7J7LGT0_9MAGN|nr:hypothetical protein GIB67_003237 [Kingdonia uniflora]
MQCGYAQKNATAGNANANIATQRTLIGFYAPQSQKLFRTKLPFPYTSVEAFERSMRVPLGPDFNPASTVDLNNRPAVVKIPGTIIRPVKYEDVDPYGRGDEDKTKGQQAKKRKTSKSGNGYKAKRKLLIYGVQGSKGEKYLKCENPYCLKFTWLRDAMKAEEKRASEKKLGADVKINVTMNLNDLCSEFKGKAKLG